MYAMFYSTPVVDVKGTRSCAELSTDAVKICDIVAY